MNYIDLLLILLVLMSVVGGWRRGFIGGLFGLIRWAGSLLLAVMLYQYVARLLESALSMPEMWSYPFAFLLTAFLASALLDRLLFLVERRLPVEVRGHVVNRVLGIVPGLASGLILAAIVAALLLALPLPDGMLPGVRESGVANALASTTDRIEEKLSPLVSDGIGQTLNRLAIRPESNERLTLPYRVSDPPPRPDLEAEMLRLVNEERAAEGLPALAPDTALRAVARRHSADMFARGYFAHVTPEGRDPFDRIAAARIRFRTAGENLALAPTVTMAHRGLMNSPGHRANILRRAFGRVGIGILDGGVHGIMVTQNFRN